MTIRDATSSQSAPKPRRRPRGVESDDEAGDGRARSSIERVPSDDRKREEIVPQAGYGGGTPDQSENEH